MDIQVINSNSLNIARGLYGEGTSNTLPDATANTLISEGAAVLTAARFIPVSQVVNAPSSYLGVVATRCKILNFNASGTGFRHIQARSRHVAMDKITKPALVYSSVYTTNEALAALGTATVECAIEYRGLITRMTFGGAIQGVVPNGKTLQSDRISLPDSIPAGAVFFVRTYVIWSGTDSAYIRDSLAFNQPNSGETCEFASTALVNRVMGGVIGTNGNALGVMVKPVAIVDDTTKITWFIAGDSRSAANYTGDFNHDVNGISGEAERLVGNKFAVINAAVSGDSFFNVTQAGRYAERLNLSKYCSHVLSNYGINDPAQTQAQFKTSDTTFAGLFGTKPYYRLTLGPYTTSTDQWQTLTGQAIASQAVNVVAINQGIRAGDGPHVGYFDTANFFSSSPDSGLWRVDGIRTVNDAATTAGNLIVTSATAAFTQADKGKNVRVQKQATITGLSGDGTTVTVTAAAHGFATGNPVRITGANIAAYNTVESSTNFGHSITVVNADTFTYASTASGAGTTGTARINRGNGIIRTVNSATSITLGNYLATTNATTDSSLFLMIGQLPQDGLHATVFAERELELSNVGRNLLALK